MSEAPAYKKQKLGSAPSTEALGTLTTTILSRTVFPQEEEDEREHVKSLSALNNSLRASARVALDLESSKGNTQTQAQNKKAGLMHLLLRLQASSEDLQASLDLHSLPAVPTFCAREPTVKAAKQLASLAHKLSYTTFAPTRVFGHNLFRPPAPQDFDFRASILHELARKQNAASHSAGFAQGMQQSKSIPVLEPEKMASTAVSEPAIDATSQAKPAASAPHVGPMRTALDFILNPDLEEAEELSSSEDESD